MPGGQRLTGLLRRQHREIEAWLDRLPADLAAFHEAWRLLQAHYDGEALFFAALRAALPELVSKMEGQHEEARELGRHVEEMLAAGGHPDLPLLIRRFHAIAQHNLIEEERELFHLADRWLPPGEQERLAALLS